MEEFSFNGLVPSARILEWQNRFMKFELEGTTEKFARVLGRIMRKEVPTIAIDDVLIETNSSFLIDTLIARRLTHIPLTSDFATSMYYPNDCPVYCNRLGYYCNRCSVEFRLSAKCITGETLDVTSKHLISSNPDVVPFDFRDTTSGGTAIVTLRPGEELTLKAIARKGIGKDKIKWSPVKVVTYFCPAEVIINEQLMETLTLEQKKEWVATCPTNMFHIDPQTQKVVLSHHEAYHYDYKLLGKAKAMGKPGLVKMCEKKDTYTFTVETTGALGASQIVMSALKILKQKLLKLHNLEDHYDLAGLASDIEKLESEN